MVVFFNGLAGVAVPVEGVNQVIVEFFINCLLYTSRDHENRAVCSQSEDKRIAISLKPCIMVDVNKRGAHLSGLRVSLSLIHIRCV